MICETIQRSLSSESQFSKNSSLISSHKSSEISSDPIIKGIQIYVFPCDNSTEEIAAFLKLSLEEIPPLFVW